jgi:hypothetical protein
MGRAPTERQSVSPKVCLLPDGNQAHHGRDKPDCGIFRPSWDDRPPADMVRITGLTSAVPRPSGLGLDGYVRSPLSYALTRVSTSPRASRARSSSSRLYVVRLKQSSGETSYLIGRCPPTPSFRHIPNACRSTLSTATAFRIGPATSCDTSTGRWRGSQNGVTVGSSRHRRLGRTCLLFMASRLTGGSLCETCHWNPFGSETCCQCAASCIFFTEIIGNRQEKS